MKYEHKNGKDFNFLIGKSIIKVEEKQVKDEYGVETDSYILTCKDGTIIEVATNQGCGGCGNGWSSIDLKCLENNQNVITDVITEYEYEIAERHKKEIKDYDMWDYYEDDRFKIFIYYEDSSYNSNSREVIQGEDGYGNGCYGGGFYITIKDIKEQE